MRFANDAIGVITASRFENLTDTMLRVDVLGDKGRLSADVINIEDMIGRLTHSPGSQEILFYDREDHSFNVAFERSIQGFVEKTQGAENPAASGKDGLAILEIERALVISQRDRQTVSLYP
ncbi:MAG: hypothetical protein IT199_07810, partial [Solirubrobacterales bacterium]|nr:hypothetical protein [Solirubrobacterales bacterium]